MVKVIKNWWRVILAIIVLGILIGVVYVGYVLLVTGKWPDWIGFGEYIGPVVLPNQTFQPAKTLWDWMQLLIIPAILAGGAYWLNESARNREKEFEEKTRQQEIEISKEHAKTEREIASDNRQETALQTYFDKMTELLLDKVLRESEDKVRAVARARTLTVMRRLDGERKGALLRFLYEADLINKDKIVINLAEADLSEAELSKANLYVANLSGVNLSNANLSKAKLSKTNLGGAKLSNANLRGAKYTKNAADINDTIWPDGFDPVAAGAINFSKVVPIILPPF